MHARDARISFPVSSRWGRDRTRTRASDPRVRPAARCRSVGV